MATDRKKLGGDHKQMTNMSQAQIKSIEAKLLKLAEAQGRSGMEARILFLLERAVARMVLDPELQHNLVFKGGFVSLRVYGSKRFTTDVDAVVRGISSEEAVARIQEAMNTDLADGVWYTFESQQKISAQGEYGGLGLKFRAGLGPPPAKIQRALQIGIDLGIGDPVTPGALATQTPFSIGEGNLSWKIYPVETMIAEKMHALLFLGDRNSRSKDIYDLNHFWDQADLNELHRAIEATFRHRAFPMPALLADAVSKIDTTALKRGWASATASIRPKLEFDDVFEALKKKIQYLS